MGDERRLPVLVCERYAGSRIAMFSTGNVYGLTPVSGGGSRETDRRRRSASTR